MHGLQAFVLRARALKLYRRALRAAKTAPENQRGVNAPAVVIVIKGIEASEIEDWDSCEQGKLKVTSGNASSSTGLRTIRTGYATCCQWESKK